MKKLFVIPFLFFTLPLFCQEKNTGEDVKDIFKVTVLNPGISYEKRIGKFQTLYFQCFMNVSASKTSTFGGDTYDYYYDPAFTVQYRYYYNEQSRRDKGKRTSTNNLNYLAPVYQVFFSQLPFNNSVEPDERRPVHFIATVWGIQRNYNSAHFALDLNVGPGVLFTSTTYTDPFNGTKMTKSESQFAVYAQLNLGFWLSKK